MVRERQTRRNLSDDRSEHNPPFPQRQLSLTGYCQTEPMNMPVRPKTGKLSGDFRRSWRGVDYFGEFAWDFSGKSPGAILGAVFPLGGDWKLSSAVHSYSSSFGSDYTGGIRGWTKTSDEHGATVGLEKAGAFLTADFAVKDRDRSKRQVRVLFKLPLQLTGTSVLSIRITERFRPLRGGSSIPHRGSL